MPGSSPSTMRRIAAAAMLLAGFALWRFAPDQRLDLLQRVQRVQGISDRFQGGTSNVHIALLPAGIRFQYALGSAWRYPWAGINLRLADSSQTPLDLTRWHSLEVSVLTTNRAPLRIQLLSDDFPLVSGPRDSSHPIYHILEFSPSNIPIAFAWTDFQIPSWWRDQNQRQDVQRLDLLDRLRSIEFHNGFTTTGEDSSSIDILKLDLVGPSRFLRGMGLLIALIGGIWLLASWLPKRPPEPELSETASSAPGSVVLGDPRLRQREIILQALREKFADPELSLESFAVSQGLSPRLVASLLKEATSLHFKGALNDLRLNEAARLLRESRANVSEIAFAVGFQNASHFGRAFRERFGRSPSDFRMESNATSSSERP